MNNNKRNSLSGSQALINSLLAYPESAYNDIINSGIYLDPGRGQAFWAAYQALDFTIISERHPQQTWVFYKLGSLHLFFELLKIYRQEALTCEKKLQALNPHPDALLKALFLTVELGSTPRGSYYLAAYNWESLSAIKEIYVWASKVLKPKGQTAYNLELFNTVKHLLMLRVDLLLIRELADICVWAGYEIEKSKPHQGYRVSYPPELSKGDNLYLLNVLKSRYKSSQLKKESQELLSSEQHFKAVDPALKTNEGLAVVFHSSGIKTEASSPGFTSIQLADQLFEQMNSEDEVTKSKAHVAMMYTALNQSFHYHYRHALASVFQPKEAQEIHQLRVKLPTGINISLYELFCTVSCFYAIADNYRYVRQLPGTGGIGMLKHSIINQLKREHPEKTNEQLQDQAEVIIANQLSDIEKINQPFDILSQDGLLNHIKKIEELKQKTDRELIQIIDFLCSANNHLPFNPIYKLGEEYLIPHQLYSAADVNRMLYDYFVTKQLYSSKWKVAGGEDAKEVGGFQKLRSEKISSDVQRLLAQLTSFSTCEVKFPGDNKYQLDGLNGDIDVLAYFENENIIMPIQIKLSNTSIIQEKGKAAWIHDNIYTKGKEQIEKDLKLLKLKNGQKLIAKRLGIAGPERLAEAKICPLIVTDNFYADHYSFTVGTSHIVAYCISLFELKCLITGIQINSKQDQWPSLQEHKSAALLLDLIKNNVFWSFLNEEAADFKIIKELKVINPENRIKFEA